MVPENKEDADLFAEHLCNIFSSNKSDDIQGEATNTTYEKVKRIQCISLEVVENTIK